ncbi:translation initiation factor eIF4A [Orbilia ellipsospora]|uniref:RNA helicase n=1 Tax=Orbilia ellipsospora TaxID=2528407 RepID=A0AAV9XMY0_9PEZI
MVDDKATTYEQMQLSDDLIKGIYANGFDDPAVIIQRGIIPILNGSQVVIQVRPSISIAAAISIAALQTAKTDLAKCQVLILSADRESAARILDNVNGIGKFMDVKTLGLMGGSPVANDIAGLAKSPQIVVGTPARVSNMTGQGALDIGSLKLLILDQVDEMFKAGVIDTVKEISLNAPNSVQNFLFSATLDGEIEGFIKEMLTDPVRISVSSA